jgi:DNA-binding transcriptional LysR family regulator
MMAEFPDVRLDLTLREDVPTDPAERSDVQIAVEQGPAHRPGLVARHLLDDPYVAVLPVDHPLAAHSQLDLAALAGDRWVDNDFARGWCRRNLIEACHAAGFSPPFHVEAHDYPTAIAFVAAGIGVTVLPRLGARHLPTGVRAVRVVSPTPLRSIYALVREGVADAPATATVLRVLDFLGRTAAATDA